MSEQETPQPNEHKWRCIYCQQFFPHSISASAHFDECQSLKERVAVLVAKALEVPHV